MLLMRERFPDVTAIIAVRTNTKLLTYKRKFYLHLSGGDIQFL